MCKPIKLEIYLTNTFLQVILWKSYNNTITYIADITDLPKSRIMILIDKTLCEILNKPFQHIDNHTIYNSRSYLLRKLENLSNPN